MTTSKSNFPEFSNVPKNVLLCTECGDDFHLAGQCTRCNCGESQLVFSNNYLAVGAAWLYANDNQSTATQ